MSFTITATSPDTADANALIGELEACLEPHYPRASRHGLSVAQLIDQQVAFFLIRSQGEPAGCGCVKLVVTDYGEIKRRYVRPRFRGRGLAKVMLDHLASYTQSCGISALRLETGIYQQEAIGLYQRAGFTRIPPFGDYREDPLSLFFEKRLGPGA